MAAFKRIMPSKDRRGEVRYYHRRKGFPLLPVSQGVDLENLEEIEADFASLLQATLVEQKRRARLEKSYGGIWVMSA